MEKQLKLSKRWNSEYNTINITKKAKTIDKAISVCDADTKYNLRYIDKHGDEHVIKFNTESEMKAKAQQAKPKGMENIIAEIVENGSIRKSYKLS